MHGSTPELPTLSAGVQLLDTDGARAVGPLGALALDHALRDGAGVYWVDSRGHARTDHLARLAPDERALDRVQVARGFTAHQHFALVRRLRERVTDETSLVVCPAVDAPYRGDDVGRGQGEALLLRALATLSTLARDHDLPVLFTRTATDGPLAAPVAAAADRSVACRQTPEGPRFVGEDFETLVYPQADGTVQTTLAFWRRVVAARCPARGSDETAGPAATGPTPTGVASRGAD